MPIRNPVSAFLAGAAIAIGLGAQAQSTITVTGTLTGGTCSYTSVSQTNGAYTFACSGAVATVPVCSPIASFPSVPVGGISTLTANCTQSPTSWTWTTPATAGAPAAPAGASGQLTFATEGVYTYTVTGTNTAGTSATPGSVTVTVANPTVVPTCVPTATPSTVTVGTGSTTLAGNCTNAPTSWVWVTPTAPAGAPDMPGAASGAAGPTASASIGPFPTVGKYTYAMAGINLIGASAPVTVDVDVVAATTCVAPAIPPKLYPAAGETIGSMYMALAKGFTSAAAVFTMPLNGTKDVMLARYNAVGSAETPTRSDVQLVVSKCPGDFTNIVNTTPATGTGVPCAYMGGKTGGELSCRLPAGTYYLNMRHVYPNASWTGPLIPLKDSCGTTGTPIYGTCAHNIAIQ